MDRHEKTSYSLHTKLDRSITDVDSKEYARKLKLWGETLRDVGILFFVFGPLDAGLNASRISHGELSWGIGFMIFGGIMVLIGVEMESRYGL